MALARVGRRLGWFGVCIVDEAAKICGRERGIRRDLEILTELLPECVQSGASTTRFLVWASVQRHTCLNAVSCSVTVCAPCKRREGGNAVTGTLCISSAYVAAASVPDSF